VLANQARLREFGLPVLSALSRKSMAWKLLKITPDDALPATIAMNTVALMNGADWIRVHDVAEAAHTVKIVQALTDNK
jgi:dihydropteroate synthase